jgi:site-specific recombinase XerD
MLHNNLDLIKKNFLEYLHDLGLSSESHKNYKSDLVHFSGWVTLKVRSFGSYIESITEAVPFLSKDLAGDYKKFMVENQVPLKTINRRLSTLRHLSRFLESSQVLEHNFMEGVENISLSKTKKTKNNDLLDGFRGYLDELKVSKNTSKNYISDVGQFLSWLETNKQ